jgi:hypothetical protein
MDRGIPKCSKIISKKEKDRADQLLVQKLTDIKNRRNQFPKKLERGRPATLPKNHYYKKQRDHEIKLENTALARKMINIENASLVRNTQIKN